MVNAGLSTTLNHNSWSKDDWSLFFACIIFGTIPLFIQLSAFHILWHTKYYERIVTARRARWIVVPPSQILAFFLLLNHACIATGLFFLIYNFQHETGFVEGTQVHHKGNFSWVVGWLVGGIFASWFPPMLIHATCNLWGPFLFELGSFLGVIMAFGYEINYIKQSTFPQLTTSSPAMWLLIFPVVFKFYMTIVACKAAIVSVTDPDYLKMCEIERSMISDEIINYDERAGGESKGDFDHVQAKKLLAPDTLAFVNVPAKYENESGTSAFQSQSRPPTTELSTGGTTGVASRHKNMMYAAKPLGK